MKNVLASLLLLAVAAGPAITAAPENGAEVKAHAIPVRSVQAPDGTEIQREMASCEVLRHLGPPDVKPSDNEWIYRSFHAEGKEVSQLKCDRLMITFTDGVVSDLQLINCRAEAVVISRAQKKAAKPTPDAG